jgi:DNA polymerase elongation subunit (family B)
VITLFTAKERQPMFAPPLSTITFLERRVLTTAMRCIYKGDKIKFAYLKSPNPIQNDVIAISTELPPEFGLEKYIDRERMFQQTFIDIIESILNIVGWQVEEKATLF